MSTMGKRILAALVAAALLGPAVGQPARALAEDETQLAASDVDSRYLTLASAASPLTEKDVPEGLEPLESRRMDDSGSYLGGVYLASSMEIQVVDAVANALLRMFGDAENDGVILYVRQGYRSYAEEKKRYDRLVARGTPAQKPGECDYQTGLAVTVVGKAWRAKSLTAEFGATEEAQWMKQHCSRYGFVLRYPEGKEDVTGWDSEPWHLRFVGIEVAEYMQQHNLCLEEFVELYGDAAEPFAGGEDEDQPDEQGGDEDEYQSDEQEGDEGEYQPDEQEDDENGGADEASAEPTPLPEGVLDEVGPDGDHEITLFHD